MNHPGTPTAKRTLYVAGFASWPASTPPRATKRQPCNHLRLHVDGTCAGCRALIYDRRRLVKRAG